MHMAPLYLKTMIRISNKKSDHAFNMLKGCIFLVYNSCSKTLWIVNDSIVRRDFEKTHTIRTNS